MQSLDLLCTTPLKSGVHTDVDHHRHPHRPRRTRSSRSSRRSRSRSSKPSAPSSTTVEGVLPEDRPSVPFADTLPEPEGARRVLLRLRPEGARQPARVRQGDPRRRVAAEAGAGQGREAGGRQEGRRLTTARRRQDFFFEEPRALARGFFTSAAGGRLRRDSPPRPRWLRGTTGRRRAVRSVARA